MDGKLYYGDNLAILREYLPSDSVDLIYLDPPFNSNRNYNVLFRDESGKDSEAQIMAFEDTWHWNEAAERIYAELLIDAAPHVSSMIGALRGLIGTNQLMAYLVMMTARLVELHRVLKPVGSLYLHCDPTASHHLKLVLDAIFGPKRYLNEVMWRRSSAHSDTKQGMRRCGKVHDVLLLYTKSAEYIWNPIYTPYTEAYLESEYRHVSAQGRRYKETDATAAKPGGDTEYDWHVKRVQTKAARWEADLEQEYLHPKSGYEYKAVRPYNGRYWGYSHENLIQFARTGALIHRETGAPRLMQFADEMPGIPLQDVWDDIQPASGHENLGYPTQKPLALLERVIAASSNAGDVVLDPFCGCGTAIAAAHKLGRHWIGIDITHLSIALQKYRLAAMFPDITYTVIGEPRDLGAARQLAQDDRYQFQWWALSLIRAKPLGGQDDSRAGKKGSDKGIDGVINFVDDATGKPKRIIVQVKSGKVKSGDIRDLAGAMQRETAPLGVFITLELPTRDMITEATTAGFYTSPWGQHPRLQILTVQELLDGKTVNMPPLTQVDKTFKRAPKAQTEPAATQPALFSDPAATQPAV